MSGSSCLGSQACQGVHVRILRVFQAYPGLPSSVVQLLWIMGTACVHACVLVQHHQVESVAISHSPA